MLHGGRVEVMCRRHVGCVRPVFAECDGHKWFRQVLHGLHFQATLLTMDRFDMICCTPLRACALHDRLQPGVFGGTQGVCNIQRRRRWVFELILVASRPSSFELYRTGYGVRVMSIGYGFFV